MNIYFDTINLVESDNIGFLPVSSQVILTSPILDDDQNVINKDQEVDIFDLDEKIHNNGCNDIVFTGDIHPNKDALLWMIPRLLSLLYRVTIIVDLNKEGRSWQDIDLIANRVVLVAGEQVLRRKLNTIRKMRDIDKLVINVDNVRQFIKCVKMLGDAKIQPMYNKNLINTDTIIKAGIYDVQGTTYSLKM